MAGATKIAVWYHCLISGGSVPINTDFALNIIAEQMHALEQSGLARAAQEFVFAVNGDETDGLAASSLAPAKAKLVCHGKGVTSEIPTMNLIRAWLLGHEDWYVLYHHSKGVTHPGREAFAVWRRRMQHVCVENWQPCVASLDAGYDAAGAHWLTPEQFPGAVTSPFFGGTFWWSTAKYLSQLPPLPAATWANRMEAESWIGRRRPYPKVRDFLPGWP
jgi:hypothetical protein